MSDLLVKRLNNQFNNQFLYLKTYEISYFTKEKVCNIVFLYPEYLKVLPDGDRQRISYFLTENLKLNATLKIKFKKSYLDKSLISKCTYEILKKHFSSLASLTSQKEIEVEINKYSKHDDNNKFSLDNDNINKKKSNINKERLNLNNDKFSLDNNSESQFINHSNVIIKISIFERYLKNLETDKISITLIDILEKNYCSKFRIVFCDGKELNAKQIQLQQKEELIKKLSDVRVVPRYEVFNVVKLLGQQIEPFPEFMSNIQESKTSVILAGELDNLTKKTYKRKKKDNEVEKVYYSFLLKEIGSFKKMNCIYFCPKSNISKVDKLKDGDKILIIANIKKEKNFSTAYVKSFSWCEIPEKIELIKSLGQEPTEYLTVVPEKLTYVSQDNLFDVKKSYSENVQKNKFVVFDVETTGLDANTCELIEIGAVKVENGVFTEKFQTLIKPKNKISKLITEINGITDAMTINAPSANDVIKDFYLFCKGAVLAGYNVGFDMKFIEKVANEIGLKFENEIQDVMLLAQQNIHLKNYKLKSVVKSLGINLTDAHRAYNDAFATAEVLLKLSVVN